MYGHTLRVNGEYLAQAQTVPANTTVAGNAGPIKALSPMGGIEIVMVAKTDVVLATGKSLSLVPQDCDTQTGAYTDMAVTWKKTHAAAKTYKAGETIARLTLPSDTRAFVKARIVTDDAAATGSVDVFSTYLPR